MRRSLSGGAGKPIEIRRSRYTYVAPCACHHKEAQHRLLEHNFGKLDGYMQATGGNEKNKMNSPLVTTTRWNWMQPLAFILCLLICVCFPVVSSAQHSTTARDHAAPIGPYLPAQQISEYVREVFQDRDGNFWFGTNGDGVCRYDGKSLTYLSVEEGFGGRAVRGILQDNDGVMWFATNGGVSRYEAGIFTNYTVANGLSDLTPNNESRLRVESCSFWDVKGRSDYGEETAHGGADHIEAS